jgi:hypothetical protein
VVWVPAQMFGGEEAIEGGYGLKMKITRRSWDEFEVDGGGFFFPRESNIHGIEEQEAAWVGTGPIARATRELGEWQDAGKGSGILLSTAQRVRGQPTAGRLGTSNHTLGLPRDQWQCGDSGVVRRVVFDVGASGRSDSDESVIAPVLVIPDEVEARRRCAKSGMFRLLTSLYSVPAS